MPKCRISNHSGKQKLFPRQLDILRKGNAGNLAKGCKVAGRLLWNNTGIHSKDQGSFLQEHKIIQKLQQLRYEGKQSCIPQEDHNSAQKAAEKAAGHSSGIDRRRIVKFERFMNSCGV